MKAQKVQERGPYYGATLNRSEVSAGGLAQNRLSLNAGALRLGDRGRYLSRLCVARNRRRSHALAVASALEGQPVINRRRFRSPEWPVLGRADVRQHGRDRRQSLLRATTYSISCPPPNLRQQESSMPSWSSMRPAGIFWLEGNSRLMVSFAIF